MKQAEALPKVQDREYLLRAEVREERRFVVRGQQGAKPAPAATPAPDASAAGDAGQSLLSADNKNPAEPEHPNPSTSLLSADNKPSAGSAQGTAKPPAQRQPAAEAAAPAAAAAPADTAEDAPESPQEALDGHGHPRQLPYDDAFYVVTHLHLKMEPTVFAESARLWLGILRDQHPDTYHALLQELAQQEQPA